MSSQLSVSALYVRSFTATVTLLIGTFCWLRLLVNSRRPALVVALPSMTMKLMTVVLSESGDPRAVRWAWKPSEGGGSFVRCRLTPAFPPPPGKQRKGPHRAAVVQARSAGSQHEFSKSVSGPREGARTIRGQRPGRSAAQPRLA